MKEIFAAKISNLKNGEMKAVKVDDENEVLLCKVNNKYYALTANCPHYGAPLAEGILNENRIVCPWHHSCFNAFNGDLMEPPSLDALEQYEIKIEGEEIKIVLPGPLNRSRIPPMAKYNPARDGGVIVIAGAGAAGNAAAEALRESGFEGKIVMITHEDRLPYDRPNLSKAYLEGEAPEEWMPLRPDSFYKDKNIEVLLNTRITEADIKKKKIIFNDGGTLSFDKLLLATGGIPRILNVPGNDLKNIFYLRSFRNCDDIINAAQNAKEIVVIGSSFIGMETAHSLKKRTKAEVTVVSRDKIPFEKVFGKEIGKLFLKEHQEEGTKFKLNARVKSFSGDKNVNAVILESGETIKADVVIIGIGVSPATGFIKGLSLEDDGSIRVDKNFKAAENIYAAGDIAFFPDWRTNNFTRIEHWRTAEQQGRTAGFNMGGKEITYNSIPFFWTRQAGIALDYVGHAADWDDIIIQGNVQEKDFLAFFVKGNKLLAAAGNGRSKEMASINELIRLRKTPSTDEIKAKEIDLISYLNTAS